MRRKVQVVWSGAISLPAWPWWRLELCWRSNGVAPEEAPAVQSSKNLSLLFPFCRHWLQSGPCSALQDSAVCTAAASLVTIARWWPLARSTGKHPIDKYIFLYNSNRSRKFNIHDKKKYMYRYINQSLRNKKFNLFEKIFFYPQSFLEQEDVA